MTDPSQQDLRRLLEQGGTPLDSRQLQLLWRFHQRLREADAKLNLTRIRSFEPMVEKHYIDSLLPGQMLALQGPVMDLGSGGGFPGIPLAIRHPDIQFKLVEGRRLRAGFLLNVAAELGLKNVEVIARKLNPEDIVPVQSVITRAFSAIDDTLERVDASVAAGGTVVFMKGPNCDEELAGAVPRFPQWQLESDVAYNLPMSKDARRLIVFRKVGPAHSRPTVISSSDNARIKSWRKLQHAKGIKSEALALLAGERYIRELYAAEPDVIQTTIATAERDLRLADDRIERIQIGKELMRELDIVSGVGPLAVVAAPSLPIWAGPSPSATGPMLMLATQLPENLGAILRTAEALGLADIVLLEECANPYLPKALRASGPAPWRLNLWRGPKLAELAPSKFPLVALDVKGEPLPVFAGHTPPHYGLIVGMEGPGTTAIHPGIRRITIPMAGDVDSLNAAVATGIVLYALRHSP